MNPSHFAGLEAIVQPKRLNDTWKINVKRYEKISMSYNLNFVGRFSLKVIQIQHLRTLIALGKKDEIVSLLGI